MNKDYEPLVSIIIVNYNGKLYLEKCLKSIIENKYKRYEIILVDNNSTDDSVEFVRKNFSNVAIITLEQNYGYAEPNNIGAKQANGDLLFFLNNDTTLCPDSIPELVKILREPEIAICQSLLLTPEGNVDSSGDFVTRIGIAYSSREKTMEIRPILSARGAAMMVKKDVFWDLGGLDEKFFASFEDVDLGWRAWICGYKVVLVPSSIVYHMGGKTVQMLDSKIKFHGVKNTLLLCLVNFELSYAITSLALLAVTLITRKFFGSKTDKNSNQLFTMPSVGVILSGVNWIMSNFRHVTNKRREVNSRRKLSTSELIKMGLITNGMK